MTDLVTGLCVKQGRYVGCRAAKWLEDAIARAIMVERERCAGLSDALADGFYRLAADSPRKRKWNETLARNFSAHAEVILRGGR